MPETVFNFFIIYNFVSETEIRCFFLEISRFFFHIHGWTQRYLLSRSLSHKTSPGGSTVHVLRGSTRGVVVRGGYRGPPSAIRHPANSVTHRHTHHDTLQSRHWLSESASSIKAIFPDPVRAIPPGEGTPCTYRRGSNIRAAGWFMTPR